MKISDVISISKQELKNMILVVDLLTLHCSENSALVACMHLKAMNSHLSQRTAAFEKLKVYTIFFQD